jgi:tetratricopeptide (TPR) repeat protein
VFHSVHLRRLTLIACLATITIVVCSITATPQEKAHSVAKGTDQPGQNRTPGASAPAPTAQDILLLRRDLNQLKDGQDAQVIARADSAVNFANNVIQWSAVLLTSLGILMAVVGFLGLKEIRSIRARAHEVNSLKEQFVSHLQHVQQLETEIAEKFRTIADDFAKDSQLFIEASYNYNTATAAYDQGENQKAIEYYGRAVALQPNNTRLYSRIGRAYTNLGNTDAAIASFNKVIAADPHNAEALRGLATAYRYQDLDRALAYAQEAAAADPRDSESLDYLGLLFRDKLRIGDAIDSHLKARAIKQRPETDFFLGLLYAHEGDLDRSLLMMHSAYISLRDAQASDKIKPLWAGIIRCGKALVEGNEELAIQRASEVLPFVTTARTAEAVISHLRFLLGSLHLDAEGSLLIAHAIPPSYLPTRESPVPDGRAVTITNADAPLVAKSKDGMRNGNDEPTLFDSPSASCEPDVPCEVK